MNIVVLGGGNSPERDVSLRSASAVSEALRAAGYEVLDIDPKNGWQQLDNASKEDIIFPILHGAEGEDGVVQKMLEDKGLRYLGSSSESSRLCFDKGLARNAMQKAGIPVAHGVSNVTAATYRSQLLVQSPHALKAQRGGSSIGTYLVKDPNAIDQTKVDEVFTLDSEAVIEELIEGTEITVPILDGKALPVIEIIPPVDGEFDYENKYNGKSQEICPAKSVDAPKQKEAQGIAEKVNQLFGCRHLSRVDIMVRRDGSMAVLEINTIPGLTKQSLYPIGAQVAGLSMPMLMQRLVSLVKRDYPLVKD